MVYQISIPNLRPMTCVPVALVVGTSAFDHNRLQVLWDGRMVYAFHETKGNIFVANVAR